MSGKTTPMREIKQLIQLRLQGKGTKYCARTLGLSKNTVKSYLHRLVPWEGDLSVLLLLDDATLEASLLSGDAAYSDERFECLKTRLDDYTQELGRTGVTRRLLWEEYRLSAPSGYGYTQFCYHLQQHMASGKPSMVLEHKPGDKLYIDFAGKTASYVDRETGEEIVCQLFVASLPYSDYGFVYAVASQGIEDFIEALCCCLEFLEGVPGAIVPDNLKSAVVKTCRYEPEINAALQQLGNHYQSAIVPARVAHPQDKALVENHVKLIYQRVLAPLRKQVFFSRTELNAALAAENRKLNQRRMQQRPYTREERFLAGEKSRLRPLPAQAFALEYEHSARVQKNNHVLLSADKHYYSVPYLHIGQQAKIRYTHTLVRIYVKGAQVAAHPRNRTPSGYTSLREHLCSQHQHYLDRSPEYYLQQAQKRSPVLAQLVACIFALPRHPEQLYKTCDGLIRLQRDYPAATFEQACSLALQYEQYTYSFVKQLLTNRMSNQEALPTPPPLPEHDNLRGKNYYQ